METESREIAEAIRLWNRRLFFECHETLELAWNKAQGREKTVLQGWIQAAAGLHKLRQSRTGAVELLRHGAEKLSQAREPFLLRLGERCAAMAEAVEQGRFDPKDIPDL